MNIAYGEKCIAIALLRRFRSLLREDFETTSARRFLSYTFALFPGRRIIARRTIESFAEVVLTGFCIDENTCKCTTNDSLLKSKDLYEFFLNKESLFDPKIFVDSCLIKLDIL